MEIDGNYDESGFKFTTKLNEYWHNNDIDVLKDSQAEIERKIKDVVSGTDDAKVNVDSALNMSDNGLVIYIIIVIIIIVFFIVPYFPY